MSDPVKYYSQFRGELKGQHLYRQSGMLKLIFQYMQNWPFQKRKKINCPSIWKESSAYPETRITCIAISYQGPSLSRLKAVTSGKWGCHKFPFGGRSNPRKKNENNPSISTLLFHGPEWDGEITDTCVDKRFPQTFLFPFNSKNSFVFSKENYFFSQKLYLPILFPLLVRDISL